MNCKECLSSVEEYVENSLDALKSDQTAAHIFACESCRIVHDELKNEQDVYSRYLLKITEKPNSWDAVRREIRKASSIPAVNAGTVSGFYERFLAVFSRQPLLGTMAALVLIIGIVFGLWFLTSVPKETSVSNVDSSKDSLNEKKNNRTLPDSSLVKYGTAASDTTRISQNNNGRTGIEKKRTASISPVAHVVNESQVSLDLSEAAFNRHIEKCEMVLRSFRNAISETDESGFDISYERRLAKELLSSSVNFRRVAESQGNLPIENLLVDLEVILSDITKLPKKATSSEAKSIKGRIQESGIIAKLQIQTSNTGTSD